MKIEKLRTNHIENPMGYLMEQVSLSWIVSEARGLKTERARVEIAGDMDFAEIVFDSGERKDVDSLGFEPELELKEGVRYYWRVQVWDCLLYTSRCV